ncbi:hypothetical protein NXS19_002393 [Fusarium pseudograminearum]|nr:hypothetical protein NXS19_002393 [Fusarium pseudograminearum]
MADLAEQHVPELQVDNEKSVLPNEDNIALDKTEDLVQGNDADASADAEPEPKPKTEAEPEGESKQDDAPGQLDPAVAENTTGEEETQQNVPIDFVTMGMFIIDDIDFIPPTEPVKDILGGAGTYSALGARLLSPPPKSTSVGWIVDQGSDFPLLSQHSSIAGPPRLCFVTMG